MMELRAGPVSRGLVLLPLRHARPAAAHVLAVPRDRNIPPTGRGSRPRASARVIEEHYRACDAVVGQALAHADDRTLMIVLSDHGFNSFQRGVHLNTWLHDHGLLALASGAAPGADAGDFLLTVDWARTRAYALGHWQRVPQPDGARSARHRAAGGRARGRGRDRRAAHRSRRPRARRSRGSRRVEA